MHTDTHISIAQNDQDLSCYQDWVGSLEELVAIVNIFESSLVADWQPINKRTATYYRSKEVLSPTSSKKYNFRHILEFLVARNLTRSGWTIKQLSSAIPHFSIEQLASFFNKGASIEQLLAQPKIDDDVAPPAIVSENPLNKTEITVDELSIKLLAIGVIQQFNVVVDRDQIVDGNNIPPTLRRAMGLLGKMCIEQGDVDKFASVHETLALCKYPFGSECWPLKKFKDKSFKYSSVNLIDIDLYCPTVDCIELSRESTESNIQEGFSFEMLEQLCSSFGSRRHEAYSLLRGFIARHPVTSRREIMSYVRKESVVKAEHFLINSCYRSVENQQLFNKNLYICEACKAPIGLVDETLGYCLVRQCKRYHTHREPRNYLTPDEDTLVLRPHILAYWFGPSIDEIEIYDFALSCHLDAALYPDSDACDISIDGFDIGIDVKSYASPNLLSQSLNRSIGGLKKYKRKIIAISDSVIKKESRYLQLLNANTTGLGLEFKTVSETKLWLKGAINEY